MNNVERLVDHAEQYCIERGSHLTPKRKRVLYSLLESNKAMSAYELIDECKARFDSAMPPTSMYRILDFLREERLVHKLGLANKYVACSYITCDHNCEVSQFLICVECQRVEEVIVNRATVDDLQSTVEGAGYQLASTQFEINCICDRCAADAA